MSLLTQNKVQDNYIKKGKQNSSIGPWYAVTRGWKFSGAAE